MPLHLVGENIDKARSFRAAEAGSLIQLVRGVYADAFEDADALVLRHAVRIARYLYPRAYLAAASSALLGPGRDGRLFLRGRRTQRTRIRGLEIIQNPAPPNPDTETSTIDDGMGAFPIAAATSRHRFLESFRARSEFASSIDETMRESLRLRLIEDFGGPRAAAEAVWALARANSWLREGERAERYLLQQSAGAPAIGPTPAQLELHVAWHGGPVGRLQHDGLEWRWLPEEGSGPPLIRQTIPGRLPPFITSLLPEGWLDSVLRNPDERAALRTGKRYVSNVAIVERLSDLSRLSFDVLLSGLASHSRNGIRIPVPDAMRGKAGSSATSPGCMRTPRLPGCPACRSNCRCIWTAPVRSPPRREGPSRISSSRRDRAASSACQSSSGFAWNSDGPPDSRPPPRR